MQNIVNKYKVNEHMNISYFIGVNARKSLYTKAMYQKMKFGIVETVIAILDLTFTK